MGYSISVSARSHRLKEDMQGFLLQECRSWSAVVGDDQLETGFVGPLVDEQLTHAEGKCIIGYDYGQVAGPEREYHYSVMRWVALQVGKTRSRFRSQNATLKSPVPYIVFDSTESWPILLEAEWSDAPDNLQPHVCDSFGMRQNLEILASELAWYHIPPGTYERITATHQGKTVREIQSALVDSGFDGAKRTLRVIRSQLARLDVLWKDR